MQHVVQFVTYGAASQAGMSEKWPRYLNGEWNVWVERGIAKSGRVSGTISGSGLERRREWPCFRSRVEEWREGSEGVAAPSPTSRM